MARPAPHDPLALSLPAAPGQPARLNQTQPTQLQTTQLQTTQPGQTAERSKSRLLEHLKRHGAQPARQVALALGISLPAARRHLQDLLEDGLLTARTEKPSGRGRPQHVYALSERGDNTFPRAYPALCCDVLTHIEGLFGDGAVMQVMDARRRTLHARLAPQVGSGSLEERLHALARQLDEVGYAAEVEQVNGVWYLLERNCPAPTVAREFPQLCQSEQELYADLLAHEVVRESKIACGAPVCRYRIGAPRQQPVSHTAGGHPSVDHAQPGQQA